MLIVHKSYLIIKFSSARFIFALLPWYLHWSISSKCSSFLSWYEYKLSIVKVTSKYIYFFYLFLFYSLNCEKSPRNSDVKAVVNRNIYQNTHINKIWIVWIDRVSSQKYRVSFDLWNLMHAAYVNLSHLCKESVESMIISFKLAFECWSWQWEMVSVEDVNGNSREHQYNIHRYSNPPQCSFPWTDF